MEFFTQDYLMHHGVKGQKWGVRRYQNKDGSLTELGKLRLITPDRLSYPVGIDEHYRDEVLKKFQNDGVLTEYGRRQISKAIKKYGLADQDDTQPFSFRKSDYDLDPDRNIEVKKDTELFRFASSYEPIDHKRKYVAVGEDARYEYDNPDVIFEMLGIPTGDPVSEFVYSPTKDLQIMQGRQAVDLVLDKCREQRLTDTVNLDRTLSKINIDRLSDTQKLSKTDKEVLEYQQALHDAAEDRIRFLYDENVDDIASEAKKMGYDAVVDLFDMGMADSIVLTDPQTSVKLKRKIPY